jgi:hypothetical protein
MSFTELGSKAAFLRSALDGQSVTTFLVDGSIKGLDAIQHPLENVALALNHAMGPDPSVWRFYPGLLFILLGILVAKGTQRKWLLFFLISGSVAWFQSAITLNAGNLIHHAALFWINWYCALSLAVAALLHSPFRGVRLATVFVVGLLCVRGAVVIGADYGELIAHPGASRWTNADAALTDRLLNSHVGRIIEADWGIQNVVRARSGNRITVSKQSAALHVGSFDQQAFDACAASNCVVVTHAPGKLVSAPADLEYVFRNHGFGESGKSVVYDTHGIAGFEFFDLTYINGKR